MSKPSPCPYDLLESYWRHALEAALQEAGVPVGTLNRAQLGAAATSLIISRELEPSDDTFIARASVVTVSGGSSS